MSEKMVVIMRAAPGSGKSTYVKQNYPDAVVCSADHYHINQDGVYDWKPDNAAKAHSYCHRKFNEALENSKSLVVVDNTNTSIREMRPYVFAAKKFGYQVKILRIETPLEIAIERNIHNVPKEVIENMYNRIQDIPDDWEIEEEKIQGTY